MIFSDELRRGNLTEVRLNGNSKRLFNSRVRPMQACAGKGNLSVGNLPVCRLCYCPMPGSKQASLLLAIPSALWR
jgi:hypothetical protein